MTKTNTKLLAIIKPITKLFSKLMQHIFFVIVVGIVGVSTLIAWVLGALNFLIHLLNTPMPLWATIALVFVVGGYVYLKVSKSHSLINLSKPKYYKYCPNCDAGVDVNSLENYCPCGTKYFDKCPSCGEKIIRYYGNICSFCGAEFPLDRIPI